LAHAVNAIATSADVTNGLRIPSIIVTNGLVLESGTLATV
jgi:hypothetical protein